MNKQLSTAFLIIFSILVLAMKDSASLIHTILHYIPNNSWHQHDDISNHHHHPINPLEIHKYLQNKHTHAHDLMDHIHHDEDGSKKSSHPEKINLPLKIDYYFQVLSGFHFPQHSISVQLNHFSIYLIYIRNGYISLSCQPPQI